MMMVLVASTRCCLSQILNVGELVALRGFGEVCRELVELARGARIAVALGSLGGCLQVGGDLLGDLRVPGRIRLLKLLERA